MSGNEELELQPELLSQVCRICLTMNAKMYSLLKYDFQKKYQDITGIKIAQEDKYPISLCWECAHRLSSCHRFKTQAVLSHCLLTDLLHTDLNITEQNLKTINRHKNGLESKLTKYKSPPDYFDLKVNEDEIDKVEIIIDSINADDEYFSEDEIKKETVNVKAESLDGDDYDRSYTPDEEIVVSKLRVRPKRRVTRLSETKTKKKIVKSKTKVTKVSKSPAKQKTKVKPKIKESAENSPVSRKKAECEYNSLFHISSLTLEEQIDAIQKRKNSERYVNAKHKCEICYKVFADGAAFKFHSMYHTNECGEHVCVVCKMHFKTSRAMRHHSMNHKQKFTCKECPFVATHRGAAKHHFDFHKGTKYKCPHCPEDFVNKSTFQCHVRIKHPSDIVCELCGYSFISYRGLDLHKKLKHRFDEPSQAEADFSCEQCELTFLNAAALETHIKVSPKHVLPFADEPTKKRNKNEKLVKRKNRKKPDPDRRKSKGPIQCEQCEAQLGDAVAYYRHFRRAHPGMNRTSYPQHRAKTRLCDQCGRMFETLAHLRDHINVHGTERAFKCEYCAKSFKTKYYLTAHLRIHTGKKKVHNCTVCGKGFASNNLKRHMLIHTGLKPFECEMCGKFFKDPAERKLHITHVHLKVPWPKRNRGARTAKQEEEEYIGAMIAELLTHQSRTVRLLFRKCLKAQAEAGRTEKKDQSQDSEASSTNTDMLWSACDDPKISLLAKTSYML